MLDNAIRAANARATHAHNIGDTDAYTDASTDLASLRDMRLALSETDQTTEITFPVITICGSMRYYPLMLHAAEVYTANGYIIIMPFVQKGADRPGGNSPEFVAMLDRMHLVKIDMAGAILVVGRHRGESTTREIAYANASGKPVIELDGTLFRHDEGTSYCTSFPDHLHIS